MTSILRITDGTNAVDLLSTTYGFHLNSWQQTIVLDKGGGVFQDSPLAEGRQLVYRQLANTVETYNMKLKQISQDIIARDIQDLMQLLEQAKRYWLKPSDRTPVWIEAKSTDETNTRYALIVNYQIPQLSNPYAQPFLQPDCLALLDDFDLIIERQHWLSNEPGSDTAIQTSNLQTVYRYGVFEPGTATDTADAGDDTTFNTTDPLDLGTTGNVAHDIGIRFQTCTIPQGATIVDARLAMIMADNDSLDLYVEIYGEDTDDAATFSTYANFTGRTRTTATSYWIIGATSLDEIIFSPDITSIIQEVVDRAGFSSGNDIVLFVETDRAVQVGTKAVKGFDAGSPFHQLIVTWTESTVFGRAATTTNEVYVANKFNLAQLTHVYSYDSSLTTFSSNRLNATPPYNIFPDAGIAQSDIVYIGISDDSDNAIEGTFNNVVFDLVPFEPNSVTDFQWQYWNGSTWANIPADFADGTGAVAAFGATLINSGVRSIHFQPPSLWAKTTINSVSAYWIRCIQAFAITVTQEAEQQNRQMYTVTQPYLDIASGQVLGDIRSVSRMNVSNRSGAPFGTSAGSQRLILGVKSVENSPYFTGYMNASNFQNPKGIFFSVGDDTTEGDACIDSPNTERSTFTATDTVQATRGIWEIGGEVINSWIGEYHVYFRGYFQNQAGSGFPKINIQVQSGSENIISTGKQRSMLTTADFEIVDLGKITIPSSSLYATGESPDVVKLNLQIQADTIADVIYMYDLILIPTEIWASNLEANTGSNGLYEYLEIDSTKLPKINIRASLKRSIDDKKLGDWTPITNSKFGLLAEENLRLVALSAVTSGNGWISEPWVAHSVQLFNTNRYFGLRGGN